MKKIIKYFAAFIAIMIVFTFVTIINVNSATSDAYGIFTNPGQYADCEMSVAWQTDLKYTQSYLIYTKKSDTQWANAIKVEPTRKKIENFLDHTSVDINQKEYTQLTPYLLNTVRLYDLDIDTEYMYKVGQYNMSDVHYFKTGGASEYTMILMSDFHTHLSDPARTGYAMGMIDKLEEISGTVDFILDAGDTVHIGGCNDFYIRNAEEQNYKDYFWAGALGNHDNRDWANTSATNGLQYFRDTHAYPLNGPEGEEGVMYYFIYSDTLFLMVDSVHTSSAKLPAMKEWCQNVIDSNPTKYIIFVQHYAWFELLNADDDEYTRWSEFFDKNQVDLAITGHHHIYARSKLIRNGVEDPNGTVYVVTSSSDKTRGRGTYATGNIAEFTSASALEKQIIAHYWTQGSKTIGGILIDVKKYCINLKLYDSTGVLQDNVTMPLKREALSMTKEQKIELGKNIQYVQNNEGVQTLILPDNLYGYVQSYEVYNGKDMIASSAFINKSSRFLSMNLENNLKYNLTVKVNFKDDTNASYPITINTVQSTGFLSKLRCIANTLEWDVVDANSQITTYYIYKDNKLIGDTTENKFVLPSTEAGAVYRVDALNIKTQVLQSLEYHHGLIGDINNDGAINNLDVKTIQKYINGEVEFSEGLKAIADFDNNGKVNVKDAVMLKLYLDGVIPAFHNIYYTVTFMDANGEVIEKVKVKQGEDAIPTFTDNYQYKVLSWNGDFHNVTYDQVIYPIYVK